MALTTGNRDIYLLTGLARAPHRPASVYEDSRNFSSY